MSFRLESAFADGRQKKVLTPHSILKLGNELTTNSENLQQFESRGLTGSDLPSCGLAVAIAVKLLRVLSPARDAGVTSRRAHDGEALHSEGGRPRCSRLRTRISRIGKG
jgi:hypothetical protein